MKNIFTFKRLRSKLLFRFSIILLLMLLLSGYSFYTIYHTSKETDNMISEELFLLINGENLAINIAHSLSSARAYLIDGSDTYKNSFKSYTEEMKEHQEAILTKNDAPQVIELFNEMVNNIKTVTSNLNEVTDGSQKMNEAIQEIASISEEAAAGVEETATSTEETSSSMEEVTASSNELAQLATQLNKQVEQFKLS